MIMWQLLVILGLVFLVLEMFTPMLFFLNFAIASFITAIASFIITDINILMLIFVQAPEIGGELEDFLAHFLRIF